MFWLDAAEPEISTGAAQAAADDYNSSIGSGQTTGMMFPDCEPPQDSWTFRTCETV